MKMQLITLLNVENQYCLIPALEHKQDRQFLGLEANKPTK